jgi:hypothetical protein
MTKHFLFLFLGFISVQVFGQTNTNAGTYAGNGGAENTSIGYQAGDVVTGNSNTFLGAYSGLATSTGTRNVFIGYATGRYTTTAGYNVFLGTDAGYKNVSGSSNTFLGNSTGYLNTSGASNVFIGDGSGSGGTIASRNTFVGTSSGSGATASDNSAFGYQSGKLLTSGIQNTFLGSYAGYNAAAGGGNVFIGYQAGYNETGSNKLYIDNSNTTTPLIYGDFNTNQVGINALPTTGYALTVNGSINLTTGSGFFINGVPVSGDLSFWSRNGSSVYNLNDNIGIGKNNPTQKLDVNGVVNASAFFVNGVPFAGGGSQWTTSSSSIYYNSGSVAIGTATPETTGKLTVGVGTSAATVKQGVYIKGDASSADAGPALILDNTATATAGRTFIRGISRTTNGTAVNTDLTFYNGKIGIGTNTPDAPLTVNGQIHTKEVVVDVNIAPDYVFEQEYDLRSIEEVKLYIDEHKHLPEVPSAKVMEAHGVELGEMNMLLLEKVEELTLYTIQQNEMLKQQNEAIKKLEAKIAAIEASKK